jgi:phage RecT family recombinase
MATQQNKPQQQPSQFPQLCTALERDDVKGLISKTLGAHRLDADVWYRQALATIEADNNLSRCTVLSVLGSLLTAAKLGLSLDGPLGHAYLSPRWNDLRKSYECQFQVGYRGLVDLALRDPQVRNVEATLVCENDTFTFSSGTKPDLVHTWDPRKERGQIVAVYSGLRFRDGFYDFRVYPMGDIMDLREVALRMKYVSIVRSDSGEETFYKKLQDGKVVQLTKAQADHLPWVAHMIPMAQKTAIRWSAKYWRIGNDFDVAASLAGMDDTDQSQGQQSRAEEMLQSAGVAGALADLIAGAVSSMDAARAARDAAPIGLAAAATPPPEPAKEPEKQADNAAEPPRGPTPEEIAEIKRKEREEYQAAVRGKRG